METVIYEGAQSIGTLKAEQKGLYWVVTCQLHQSEALRRVYAVAGLHSEYLGIPDAKGSLSVRIAKKLLPEIDCAVVSTAPRGHWKPWRGEIDGVIVDFCHIREEENGFCLALPEEEAVKFPAWTDRMERDKVNGAQTALLMLDANGRLPLIQKDNGGTEYETNDGNTLDPLLLAQLPADYSYGIADESEGRQTDRDYL